MIKVDIFSGFLGAGKTTLIQKLLREVYQGQKLVLLENEFGEVGIDGGFMKDAGIQIAEMNSGCICCSLAGDLGVNLKSIVEQYHPERILVEPSGVGKLSEVIRAIHAVADECELAIHSKSTIVDATKCRVYLKNFGEFFADQIAAANTIILSRTQKLDDEKLQECIDLIRPLNGQAAIITTPWQQLDASRMIEAMENRNTLFEEILKQEDICPECGCHHHGAHHHHDEPEGHSHEHCHEHGEHHHHSHHHADEIFTSMGAETARKYTRDELENILKCLNDGYGTILRAKGILPSNTGDWLHFDYVPGEYEIRNGGSDYTGRLCVIGSDLKEAEIRSLFDI